MSPRAARVLALALGTLAAALLLWIGLRLRGREAIGVVDQRASVERVLLERTVAPRGLGPFDLRPGPPPLVRFPVDEATVHRLFALGPALVFDPVCYYRYGANVDERIELPEHPAAGYRIRTNSAGLREDREFPAPRPDAVVLATGDSHTDGVCDNADSWPNRLEVLLAERRAGRTVEVANAGVQTYSYYHYLGSIEARRDLAPDVVVTVTYGGNDFLEVLLLHHLFQNTAAPPQPSEYWAAFRAARGVGNPELTQILYEAHRFERSPDEADRALEAAISVCGEIRRTVESGGARWVVGYLPSAYCLPWKSLAADRASDLFELRLTEASLTRIDALGTRLVAALRAQGVAVVDLRDTLRPLAEAGEAPPYWNEFHLNLRGLDLVARALLPEVERALEAAR